MTETALIGSVTAPDLHVQTFNIRRPIAHHSARHPDRWDLRRPAVGAMLREQPPALLGLQEAQSEQTEYVASVLGDRFAFVGHGRRADRTDEACPIFYDTERLELLDWSQTALSDRPDEAGSVSWGNIIPRIVVTAVFADRATGARFLTVNTHFDHRSRRARLRSARAVLALVRRHGIPAVVMGDLNAGERSAAVRELRGSEELVDAWTAAEQRLTPEWGTFPNYREPRTGRARIDWILTTPDVAVVSVGIDARRFDGRWPSDHVPVHAVIRVPVSEPSA